MKNEVVVFLFIDALGWELVSRTGFMESELPFRRKVEMQFGYSSTAVPTILSGRPPAEHGQGVWNIVLYGSLNRLPHILARLYIKVGTDLLLEGRHSQVCKEEESLSCLYDLVDVQVLVPAFLPQ